MIIWKSLWSANTWLIRNRVLRVLRRMITSYNTFYRAWLFWISCCFSISTCLRVSLNPTDNLKLSNNLETTQVYLYETREYGDHCNALLTDSSWLCSSRIGLRWMTFCLDLEKLKTDRLMSLVRRLVIQSDYKILVMKGALIWFLNNYIHPQTGWK